mmetsp:Transcript_27368/g.58545  ORF Transcript_27368/g.58545 Transcript_27368/m.58545 type:complete len:196 (+) Transcript_27368:1304-1891(+)
MRQHSGAPHTTHTKPWHRCVEEREREGGKGQRNTNKISDTAIDRYRGNGELWVRIRVLLPLQLLLVPIHRRKKELLVTHTHLLSGQQQLALKLKHTATHLSERGTASGAARLGPGPGVGSEFVSFGCVARLCFVLLVCAARLFHSFVSFVSCVAAYQLLRHSLQTRFASVRCVDSLRRTKALPRSPRLIRMSSSR